MYLVSIIPPDNAGTRIMALKRRLFQDYHSLSAWALLPMIPVVFVEEKPVTIRSDELPRIPESGLLLSDLCEKEHQVFLTSEALRNYIKDLTVLFEKYHILDTFPGLHIADKRDCAEEAVVFFIDQISSEPHSVTCWRSCLLDVSYTEEGFFTENCWWNRVVLESVCEIKLTKFLKK